MTSPTRRGLLALVLLGAAGLLPAEDLADIKKRGTLRVIAAAEEQPEMFSFKPGTEPGFEREMVEGFAKLHGLEFEAVAPRTYDERIPALLRGDGDLAIGMIDTEARRKLVDFTNEVLPARHVVVTARPHRVVASVEEFRAEKVGVMKGTSWASAAVEAGVPAARSEAFTDLDRLLAALADGKVTATVMASSDLTLAMRRHPGLQAGVTLGVPASASWAVPKQSPQLRAALDEYLDNLRKGTSWSRLVVKYFGESALSVLGKTR